MLLTQIISLPISILLFLWMLRIKRDDPFPKGSVTSMLLTGGLCTLVATILTLVFSILVVVANFGLKDVVAVLADPASYEGSDLAAKLREGSGGPTLLGVFISTFLMTALVEEGLKYLAMRLCLRREGVLKTRMDAVVCGAIVGLAFQVLEDLTYASGDLVTAIFRAFTPFHFLFGAIMGFYYGKYAQSGKKTDGVLALLLPVLIHGFYDFGLKSLELGDMFFLLALLVLVLMLGLTVFMILRIRRWSKKGTLSQPLEIA